MVNDDMDLILTSGSGLLHLSRTFNLQKMNIVVVEEPRHTSITADIEFSTKII